MAPDPSAPHESGRLISDMAIGTRSLSMSLQVAAAAFNALVSMLLLVYLARVLAPGDFGGYVATLSLAVVLLVLLEGGWPQRVYRESALAPEHAADGLAASALGHLLMAGAALVLIAAVLPLGLPGLAAALLCMVCVAAANLVSARMRAAGRFALEAGWQVGGRLLSALAIVLVVGMGAAESAVLFLAWAAGLAIALLVAGRRWLSLPEWRGWSAGLSLTLPFLLAEALVALLMKGDVAVLKGWGADASILAQYAACTRLNEAALLLFAPVGNVLLRGLRRAHDDQPAFNALWQRWVLRAAILGVAAILGSWWLGEWLMGLLFGEAFRAAGALLGYTALMLPFALGNLVLIVALLARGDERWLASRLVPAVLMMVLGMGLGGSAFGPKGAALAVALSQALFWLLALARLRDRGARLPGTRADTGCIA